MTRRSSRWRSLVKIFDISGITKSPAIFDMQKLRYINGEYIRKLSPEEFYEKALPWIRKTVKSETADLREAVHRAADPLRGAE